MTTTSSKRMNRWNNAAKTRLLPVLFLSGSLFWTGVLALSFLAWLHDWWNEQARQQEIDQGLRLPSGERVLTEPASGCKYVVLDESGFGKVVVPHTSYNKHLDEPCPGIFGR